MSTCSRTFRRMSKHPKIPERLHVTSKHPEISWCLDVRLNVLEFQDAIFTLPRTFRRSKVYGCRHGGQHGGAHGSQHGGRHGGRHGGQHVGEQRGRHSGEHGCRHWGGQGASLTFRNISNGSLYMFSCTSGWGLFWREWRGQKGLARSTSDGFEILDFFFYVVRILHI